MSGPVFDAPDPIDAYLNALRQSLRNQSDRDDLVAEAEDHLREAVERRVLAGDERSLAHELALIEFGDAALVARALVHTRLHRVPQPTPGTRAAGRLGQWAGIAWLLALVTFVYQLTANPWSVDRYLAFQLVACASTLLTSLLIIGLFARAGALRSPALMLTLPLSLVAQAGNTVFTWMWPITNVVVALMLWLALLECRRGGLTFGDRPTRLMVLIWPLAALVSRAGSLLQVGPMDEYGDYPLLDSWALSIAAAAFALACWWIGSVLAGEDVADTARVKLVPALPMALAESAEASRCWPAPVTDDSKGDGGPLALSPNSGSRHDTDQASARQQPDTATYWGPSDLTPPNGSPGAGA